jgi:hypothetical protein
MLQRKQAHARISSTVSHALEHPEIMHEFYAQPCQQILRPRRTHEFDFLVLGCRMLLVSCPERRMQTA